MSAFHEYDIFESLPSSVRAQCAIYVRLAVYQTTECSMIGMGVLKMCLTCNDLHGVLDSN